LEAGVLDKMREGCYYEAVPGEKSSRGVRPISRWGIRRRRTEVKKLLAALAGLVILAGAGLVVFLIWLGDGEQTPLAGADLDCNEAARGGELAACNEDKGVALVYFDQAGQYYLIPLRVASVEDFRAKTDWAWNDWDVWEKENIDICDANIGPHPDSLMLQLSPDDLRPAECR
jgi:hypothetical protein